MMAEDEETNGSIVEDEIDGEAFEDYVCLRTALSLWF